MKLTITTTTRTARNIHFLLNKAIKVLNDQPQIREDYKLSKQELADIEKFRDVFWKNINKK